MKSDEANPTTAVLVGDGESAPARVDDADYFFASSDSPSFGTRACWHVRRASSTTRDDLLVVRLFPPLKVPGHERALHHVVLAPRHLGHGLFPVREWPVHVHVVAAPADELASGGVLDASSLQSMFWAQLYRFRRDVPQIDPRSLVTQGRRTPLDEVPRNLNSTRGRLLMDRSTSYRGSAARAASSALPTEKCCFV